jgi:hypothetical protein
MLLQLLAFVHFVTTFYEKVIGLVSKGWLAAVQSQIPDVWVFTHRNAVPWSQKEAITNTLSFYPEKQQFFKDSETKKSMDDLVTAEILDSSGILVTDVTEFFHNIRWSSMAPSVYELVLIFFLLRDILLSEGLLSSYVLRVMTIDADTLDIPLRDSRAKEEFSSWGVWSAPASSASATAEKRVPFREEVI